VSAKTIQPAAHQPPLPLDRLLVPPASQSPEAVAVDVLFVGGGPAGLAGAIELARLAAEDGIEIAVLEKAERPGDHCLSGAVVEPAVLRELLPDIGENDLPLRRTADGERLYYLSRRRACRLPVPPTMRNTGCRLASICEIVRFLANRAESLGVNVLAGYPAEALLVQDGRVMGVRTAATGLARDGTHGPSWQPPTEIRAKITVLCEGARGSLTQAWRAQHSIGSDNPQSYALGVKELWRVARPLREIVHTIGWPIPADTFGGGWMYPMADHVVSLGLVVGLDSPRSDLDAHDLLQRMKSHPTIRKRLSGGELLEWGAKIIPEGGYHAIPHQLGGDGVLVAGDAAGFVNVASLKGIQYALRSGMLAARAAHAALTAGDLTWRTLQSYDRAVRTSDIGRDLWRTRNMRPAFGRGLLRGIGASMLAWLTHGRFPKGRIAMPADVDIMKMASRISEPGPRDPNALTKLDANYKSGNATRDDIPMHLVPPADVPEALGRMYEALCPAGVYEWTDGGLVVNSPNCIDCRATDVLGPRWMPREGGSGPRYQQM
jgi:electron-transferring-flavoprotein dehydrogenase